MGRVSVLMLITALALMLGLGADILLAATAGPAGVHDGDWVVLTVVVAFVALTVFRLGWAQRLAFGVVLGTLGLLIVELSLMATAADADRPFAWYVWAPGAPVSAAVQQPDEIPCANSCGIRGPEMLPQDHYRILCVGGSTTECCYQADCCSWPRRLAERLEQVGQRVWVGNAGRGDLTTRDHLTLLMNLPEAERVDCWVVLCGINDAAEHLDGITPCSAEQSWTKTFQYRRPGGSGPLLRPLYRNLCTVSHLGDGFEQVRQLALQQSESLDEPTTEFVERPLFLNDLSELEVRSEDELSELLDGYQQNLERLVALARQRGKRLVLLTQPICPDHLRQLLAGTAEEPADAARCAEQLASLVDAYNQRMRQVCRQQRVELVDLAALLPDDPVEFQDDRHFSDTGSAHVAQTLSSSFTMLGVVADRQLPANAGDRVRR